MKEWIAAPCSTARNDLMRAGERSLTVRNDLMRAGERSLTAHNDLMMTGERCSMARNGVMMFVTMAMTAVADE